MGTSKERDGLFGKYTEHFDDDGNKVGESKEREGLFGDYTEHTDLGGSKLGESREREGLFGDYTEHTDSEGNKIGESREREGLFGNYTQHTEGFHPDHRSKNGELIESFGKDDEVESVEGVYENSVATNTTSTSRFSSNKSGFIIISSMVLIVAAYIGVVWGALVLIDQVTLFSFVWWLCVLAIIAGIPLFIGAAYIAFWLAVAAIVIGIVAWLIQYFLQNPS